MGLTGPERAAHSGTATSQIVLLHGYGADGEDLIGLADALGPRLPQTRFLAPNAPQRCPGSAFGFQWFPIPWLDGSSEAESAAAFGVAVQALDGWLDALFARGIGPEATALVGFSQGTMMALHVAPRRLPALAAVVGYSGRLLVPERLAAERRSAPPILLVHGDADPVVPYGDLAKAAQGLGVAGLSVGTHTSRGVGHGIAPDGLAAALAFLEGKL